MACVRRDVRQVFRYCDFSVAVRKKNVWFKDYLMLLLDEKKTSLDIFRLDIQLHA